LIPKIIIARTVTTGWSNSRSELALPQGLDAARSPAEQNLWCLGHPDQGLEKIRTALDLADAGGQHYTLARVLSKAAIFHQLRRETGLVRDYAETSLNYATELGFPYYMATATMLLNWTRVLPGSGHEEITQMREALAVVDRTKTEIDRPYFLGLLADAYARSGQTRGAFTVLDEALESVSSGRPFFYQAEMYRLRGDLLQKAGS
jgi:predicted ATPase